MGIVVLTTKEKDSGENVERRKREGGGGEERVAGRETEIGDGGERSSSGRSRWCGR